MHQVLVSCTTMVVLNTHIQPTHFLRAWICWCALVALSLYLCPLLLVRMHTYGMTSIMLHQLASHTHTPVPLAVYYVHLVLLTRLSFSVYVDTTYLYTYIVCALVYYTVHAPYHNILYHSIGILPPLTRLHVRSKSHILSTCP